MKKIFFLSVIALGIMYGCKNRAVGDVNQMPGAFTETQPDRDVIKQSDTSKLKIVDSINKVGK